MAQYLLTQEDIDRFGLTDAVPGDMATEQELRLMFPAQMNELDQQARQEMTGGMFTPSGVSGTEVPTAPQQATPILDTSNFLPPDVPVAQQTIGTTAPMSASVGAPMSNTGIEALLAQPAGAAAMTQEDDPYGNLSKTQRRMLAFAAISDAGAALQGKQGEMVRSLLGDFTKRADMARKAKAAQEQRELMSQIMGGASGQFDLTTPQGVDAAISAYSNFAVMNPSYASGIALKIKELQEVKANLTQEQAQVEQGEFLFPKIMSAIEYINPQGLIGEDGKPVINPNIATRIARGGSEWLQTQEYQEFKGNLNTIKNNYTFENMVKLKKQGVTFGALSENELKQVSELVGQLDPANPLGSLQTLNEINGYINLDRERRGLPPLTQAPSDSGTLTWDPEKGWN